MYLGTMRSRDCVARYVTHHQCVDPDATGGMTPDRSLTVAVLNRAARVAALVATQPNK